MTSYFNSRPLRAIIGLLCFIGFTLAVAPSQADDPTEVPRMGKNNDQPGLLTRVRADKKTDENNLEVTIKITSVALTHVTYVPSRQELRNIGLKDLENEVGNCLNPHTTHVGNNSGELHLFFSKGNDQKYHYQTGKFDAPLERLGQCLKNRFQAQEEIERERKNYSK